MSVFIKALTTEFQKLNGNFTISTVAEALATAVTSSLAGNNAKVILRRVDKIALTELE